MNQETTLQGIQVIEICNVAAGPFCGMLLADMGADLIKIEQPGTGDTLRSWAPLTEGYSENFASLNRNKRSVVLDLKNEQDKKMALKLISAADILIENNRPGVMDRLDRVRAGQARESETCLLLDFCFWTVRASKPGRGFDLTLQAMSGLMSVTGTAGGEPVKCGIPVCDFTAGLYAAFAAVSALRTAEKSGQGAHIDISMLGATLGISALQTSQYFGTGVDPVKLGSAHPRNAPYQVFCCQNGYFGMAAGNDSLWRAVCHAISKPELADDPRFMSTTLRATNQEALKIILEKIFATADADVWLSVFRDAGVPCAPVNKFSDVLSDPQVNHMAWVQPLELPNGVTTQTFASPIRFDGRSAPVMRRPPALGEHNNEILHAFEQKSQV